MFDLSIRILVVDDMAIMRKFAKKALTILGFSNFIEAADGASAWEALNNSDQPVGLIISDWNMPGSTGMDLLRRVRASQYAQTPFILLTAESDKEQVAEALTAKVDGYVVKPFELEALQAQISSVYKRRHPGSAA